MVKVRSTARGPRAVVCRRPAIVAAGVGYGAAQLAPGSQARPRTASSPSTTLTTPNAQYTSLSVLNGRLVAADPNRCTNAPVNLHTSVIEYVGIGVTPVVAATELAAGHIGPTTSGGDEWFIQAIRKSTSAPTSLQRAVEVNTSTGATRAVGNTAIADLSYLSRCSGQAATAYFDGALYVLEAGSIDRYVE